MADENTPVEIEISTLSEHFTPEELQEVTKAEPVIEPVVEPVIEPIKPTDPVAEPAGEDIPVVDDVTIEPHSDNLKAALKEERDKRKVLAAELAALRAQPPTTTNQPTPQTVQQQQQSQQIDIKEQINQYAERVVKERLGIEGDPRDLRYVDPDKYDDYMNEKTMVRIEESNKYNSGQAVRQENVNFVNELQTAPDFATLYQFALAELDELPGKKSRSVGNAFQRIDQGVGTKEDIAEVRTFTTECRAKMSGVTPQSNVTPVIAPTTSPLDKANGLPRATGLSGSKTSAMSWSQVEDLIKQGKVDQIPKEMISQIDKRLLE